MIRFSMLGLLRYGEITLPDGQPATLSGQGHVEFTEVLLG
jgi:hypothetical protein